jgi:hypothetical protein
MWAQALTIGILIAAGALTARNRAAIAAHPAVDHSWREVIEEHEKAEHEKAAHGQPSVGLPVNRSA